MKALVHTKPYNLEYMEVPSPVCKPDEVLVKVSGVGICGSDVHGFTGDSGRRIPPIIMGHEASGVIVENGEKSNFSVGDRVVVDSTIFCGECKYCLSGKTNLCINRTVLGISCSDYKKDGAMAEYIAVPERALFKLPENILFVDAVMIETASVAFHAVSLASITSESIALVLGSGVIGLFIIQALHYKGCKNIIAADIDDNRLKIAKLYGAKKTINTKRCSLIEQLLKCYGDDMVDIGFDAVGLNETVELVINSVKKNGKVVLVGNICSKVQVPLQRIVISEIAIFGSCASAGEYGEVIELFSKGYIDAKKIISVVAPLSEGKKWFNKLIERDNELLKVVLVP